MYISLVAPYCVHTSLIPSSPSSSPPPHSLHPLYPSSPSLPSSPSPPLPPLHSLISLHLIPPHPAPHSTYLWYQCRDNGAIYDLGVVRRSHVLLEHCHWTHSGQKLVWCIPYDLANLLNLKTSDRRPLDVQDLVTLREWKWVYSHLHVCVYVWHTCVPVCIHMCVWQ